MKNFKQKSGDADVKDLKLKSPNVTEYMVSRKLITFKPDTKISVVIKSLLENRITGAPVLNDKNEVVRKGGVKYTIKDGIVYDAKKLLSDVKKMVDDARKESGSNKQPGLK